jgi:hypothetical protein
MSINTVQGRRGPTATFRRQRHPGGLKDADGGTRLLRRQWVPLPRRKEKPVYIGLGTVVLIIVVVAVVMMLRRR